MIAARAIGSVRVGNILGEGVVWDDRDQAFLWVDIHGRKLFRLGWPDRQVEVFPAPYRIGSFALTETTGQLIAAFEQGFARYEYRSGAYDWMHRPLLPDGVRFNDGRVDRQGRFVAGTMVEDAAAAGRADAGALYRLEPDNEVTVLIDRLRITNALCWSPDGGTMYHADTLNWAIDAYDYAAMPAPGHVLARQPQDHGPDGATVDAAGRIWVALWGAGCVAVYDAAGAQVGSVPVPVRQPSCVALGGPRYDILAVTSASVDLSSQDRAAQPAAGDLFLFEVDATGLPECRVR